VRSMPGSLNCVGDVVLARVRREHHEHGAVGIDVVDSALCVVSVTKTAVSFHHLECVRYSTMRPSA